MPRFLLSFMPDLHSRADWRTYPGALSAMRFHETRRPRIIGRNRIVILTPVCKTSISRWGVPVMSPLPA
jgi:hypothetical protein